MAQPRFRPNARANLLWIVACAVAELLGIAAAGAWWVALDRINPDPMGYGAKLVMLAGKGASGLVEGVVLGLLQGMALRRIYPRLNLKHWIVATAGLAIAGWGTGSSFAIFSPAAASSAAPFDPGPLTTILLAAGFGLVVGALFGLVQALPLRKAATNALWWVPANALGWAAALPSIYLAASTGSEDQPLWQVAMLGVAGGLLGGLLLGLVTSIFFRSMPPRQDL